MRSAKTAVNNSAFRDLPSVDDLLRSRTGVEIIASAGPSHATALARMAVASVRAQIGSDGRSSKEHLLKVSEDALTELWASERNAGIRRVINATGVIIHTNLGRAPLSDDARRAMVDAAGYCSLEYNLEAGERGRRGERIEDLLVELTGAEDALVVNNCAAAAFFILSVFAAGGEVIISRGEMVEIGGDFRIPDVLETSGAKLREVGTTNRTKLADYEKAIGKDTRLLLRVHPSNYRIVGFTATPGVSELATLARNRRLSRFERIRLERAHRQSFARRRRRSGFIQRRQAARRAPGRHHRWTPRAHRASSKTSASTCASPR
jgi:L-seryl-tRNA(Ser) seleniumtransferase